MIIFHEQHLRRVLRKYVDYYHRHRIHMGLDKDCPALTRFDKPPAANHHTVWCGRRSRADTRPPIKGQGEVEGTAFCFTQPTEQTRWFAAVKNEETDHQHPANRQHRDLP